MAVAVSDGCYCLRFTRFMGFIEGCSGEVRLVGLLRVACLAVNYKETL